MAFTQIGRTAIDFGEELNNAFIIRFQSSEIRAMLIKRNTKILKLNLIYFLACRFLFFSISFLNVGKKIVYNDT